MKRLFAFLSSILLLVVVTTSPAYAISNFAEPFMLSELSEEDCLNFVKEQGVCIPDDYADESVWGKFVQETIAQVEDNPSITFYYNYAKTLEFANAIRDIVVDYYGYDEIPSVQNQPVGYTLTDSTVYGSWDDSYLDYNCYAYSINKTDAFYSPGDFSDNDFSMSLSIKQMADLVKEDLIELGYTSAKVTSTRPTTASSASGKRAICIRKGDYDFHFMKLSSSTWYHKPGNTNPLKYNYNPSTSRDWTNECHFRGVNYAPDTTYDSSIYYIIY